MVRLDSDRKLNTKVSRLPEVRAAVSEEAEERGNRASAKLASHFRTGRSSVAVEHGRVDSYIILRDESWQSAMSIEFGHSWRGKHVNGLYIITGAAGLA